VRIDVDGLALRPAVERDVAAIAAACLDAEIVRWLPHLPQPYQAADARRFIAQADAWRAQDRELSLAIAGPDDALLGMIGLRLTDDPPTVGYWLAPGARGRGVATAATIALARWAFERYGMPRLALHAEPFNTASVRVAERSGFMRVPGVIKGADHRDLWIFELERPAPHP
jgi:RimJ/RimL family protein N-acetyltransferase